MRVHYLSHVPFEQLGAMEAWFQERDISIRHSLLFADGAQSLIQSTIKYIYYNYESTEKKSL